MRYAIIGGILALFLMPATILIQEVAHYAGYLFYGLPNPSISYASSDFEGMQAFWTAYEAGDVATAQSIAPVMSVGLAALYGVLAEFAMGALGLIALLKRDSLIGGVLAFTALFRSAVIARLYLVGRGSETDEAHIALTIGIPDFLTLLAGLAALAATVWLMYRKYSWQLPVAVAAGTGISFTAWMEAIGPMVMP